MARPKEPITEQEFEKLKIRLFAQANPELKSFGKKLMNQCWSYDQYAVTQQWEGQDGRLIVFGLPEELRKRTNAKNYFSIYAVSDSTEKTLKCEVILSKTNRDQTVRQIDTRRTLRVSSIGELEGHYKPEDFDYLVGLIEYARDARMES